MQIIREPRVTLLARQEFVYPEHINWESDSEVAGEVVAEFAGRLCYLSFGEDAGLEGGHKSIPGRTTNEAYLGNILQVKHGSVLEHAVWTLLIEGVSRSLTHELVRHRAGFGFCLSGDTLLYSEHRDRGKRNGTKKRRLADVYRMTQTPHGRSRLKLLRLRCLDEATGTFTVGRVRDVVRSGVKPVFRVALADGKSIDCTREHRFLTADGWKPLQEIVGGLDVSPGGLATWGRDDAELLVNGALAYQDREWLRTHYHVRNLDQARIAQLAGVSEHTIRAWVRKHGLQKATGSWSVGRAPWNRGRRYKGGWTHSDETRRLLSEQKTGDGNPQWKSGITPEGLVLRQPLMDRRQEIYARDEWRCRLCEKRSNELTLHHVLPVWARPDLADDEENVVSLCRPCHLTVNGRELEYVERFNGDLRQIPADARPPVGRGNLLVPRRVRIESVTYLGEQETYDLEMEGPNHNFVANGIITHNSQLSQRYVDESHIGFVLPPEIVDGSRAYEIWSEGCEQTLEAYRNLLGELIDQVGDSGSPTMRKKRARQAARAILPNCAETKIVVTGNARAWRHFMEMRGSGGADMEIRRLANYVLEIMREEAPHIFSDMHTAPSPDGINTIEAHNNKV